MEPRQYVRSHGLGNDYLVVDGASFGLPLTEARIRLICDRHTGVGSDGILELVPPPAGFDAAVRIYNPDGSEAEKSGNGVRIFAKFCLDHGYAKSPVKIHTLGGLSAHAGQSGLVDWAKNFEPRPRLFLTHGEDPARRALGARLAGEFKYEPSYPGYGEAVEL